MANSKEIKSTIHANGLDISVVTTIGSEDDYISLTDMARHKNSTAPKDVVKNWLRMRSTIEFLGLWEQLNNPNFKGVEFDSFKNHAGENAFTLSPQQWIKATNAIGMVSKSGRYGGGTFAHKDIAFEFASWLSPEFKLYIIKDYQRLKEDESHQFALDWNVKRIISKANYRIHTDAIKRNLIPQSISKQQQSLVYANEADMLNVALFGMTAAQWRQNNPDKPGNIRDYATIEQLLVLSNLESANALLISQNVPQHKRIVELNKLAISQLETLTNLNSTKELSSLHSSGKKLLK